MKRIISAFLLLTLWLGACTSNPASTPAEATHPPATVDSVSTDGSPSASAESTPAGNSTPSSAGREAVLSEFEGQVTLRIKSEGEFGAAESGLVIQEGGALQTGENGRARLDLNPEGTIVRVAPNSAFSMPEITEADGQPKSTISLFFGKIFILLKGGSLDVQTPSGVASVRGSLLSVSFDPKTGRMQSACLEGHCSLKNENGEEVDIPEGNSGYIDENGEIVNFDGIDQDEVNDWLDEAGSEVEEFLGETLDPDQYPQIDDFEEYDFDPAEYFELEPTDDGGFYWQFDEDVLPSTDDFGPETEPAPTDESSDGAPINDLTEEAPTDAPPDAPPDVPPDAPPEEPPPSP